jgi:hypothetical protein
MYPISSPLHTHMYIKKWAGFRDGERDERLTNAFREPDGFARSVARSVFDGYVGRGFRFFGGAERGEEDEDW